MILAQNRRQPLSGNSCWIGMILVVTVMFFGYNDLQAQEEEPIPRSKVVERVDGKKYYIHEVRPGQTVYRIAKAYNLTPEQVYTYNPDSRQSIRPGQMLMFPVALVEKDMELQQETQPNEEQPRRQEPEEGERIALIHTVQKGETLYSLARKYNVSPGAIKALNPEMVDILQEGQKVSVPMDGQVAQNDTIIYYKVKPGETLYRIALNQGVSVSDITRLNPKVGQTGLKAGAIIKLPIKPSPQEEPQPDKEKDHLIHKVEAGETLYSLSMQYAISIDMLKEHNPILEDGLKEGQEIRIPVDRTRKETPSSVFLPHQKIQDSLMFVRQKDTILIRCDSLKIKASYKVALYMPLHLDHAPDIRLRDLKKGQRPEAQFKAFENIPFYQGFRLALDSMEKQGMKAQVYVHDTKGSKQQMKKLLEEEGLEGYDLVFGPFEDDLLEMVVEAAGPSNTKVVSPFSYSQRLIPGNKHLIKVISPVSYQIDALMDYVAQHYRQANIIFVYSNREGQDILCQKIIQSLAAKTGNHGENHPWKIVEYDSQGFYKVEELLESERPNLIFAMHRGEARINRFLSHLHSIREDYYIHVLGSNEWERYGSIENSYFSNLGYISFTDYLLDMDHPETKQFVKSFVETYHTWPGELAFRGFDVGYYFMYALHNYGVNFPFCMNQINVFPMHQPFQFVQNGSDAWLNSMINIFQHQNYKRVNLIRDTVTDNQAEPD